MDNDVEPEADGQSTLMGFLFGNIDKSGRLEDDILDEESKRQLNALSALGVGSLVQELTDDTDTPQGEENRGEGEELASDTIVKAENAVDYSNIMEFADDETDYDQEEESSSTVDRPSAAVEASQTELPVDAPKDSTLMPPPSWIPEHIPHGGTSGTAVELPENAGRKLGSEGHDASSTEESIKLESEEIGSTNQGSGEQVSGGLGTKEEAGTGEGVAVAEEQGGMEGTAARAVKLNTPLATMLPPELADQDVTQWFPDFRSDKVLRFSRLFKPTYRHKLWKKQKKKKDELTDTSRSDIKSAAKPSTASKAPTAENLLTGGSAETEQGEAELEGGDVRDAEGEVEGKEGEEEGMVYCPFDLNLGRDALPDELMTSDAVLLCQSDEMSEEGAGRGGEGGREQRPRVAEWRYGPAQLWYDMLGVDDTGEGFDYGFKLKKEHTDSNSTDAVAAGSSSPPSNSDLKESCIVPPRRSDDPPPPQIPDDAFLMVTQLQWEDDVIWNGEDVKHKILSGHKLRAAAAGWVPSMYARDVEHFNLQMATNPTLSNPIAPNTPGYKHDVMLSKGLKSNDDALTKDEQFYSLFPVENSALLYDRWEENIIWDAENMDHIPEPTVLTLDPNDEHLILEIPEDREPATERQELATKKEKEVKKSRFHFGKSTATKDDEEEQDDESSSIQNKDPFNLSNDEYYNPKLTTDSALGRNFGGTIIQHSTPAVELRAPYFPTHLTAGKLRCFHRPPLKKYSHGAIVAAGAHPVLPLLKQIKRKERLREQERQASGGGEIFFMRSADDLTGKDGEIVLAEYSEEFPPLLSQIGMVTKIKNYYKRRPGKDLNPPQFKYGELAYAHTSPMLGTLAPGQCLPAFENNMFRAPVYQHRTPDTDFLIIRNRMHYYIRELETVFAVGQECPLVEVPGPNSKKANNFIRDFLQVCIYRLFWKSKDHPRRIKMEDVKRAFPTHSESSIRKRLKMCADFRRTGADSNWWVLKPDFRLPSEEEMRALVVPEQCCAYYSMLAAEQRLKDAGYGEKSLFAPDDDNEEETQTKIEDEVRCAPWNTTRAYIAAMKGRCLLALTGVADPTGCGEGFSYVKVPNKPQQKDDQLSHTPVKRTVTGTDADLRRLPLKEAKNLLKKFGVPDSDVKKMSRWQVINVVREMSTEQAKAAQDADGVSKFARGNRYSVAEHLDRYKRECNEIFNLQNKVLSCEDIVSTDDDSSEAEDSDFEEMGKNLENLLANKKTSSQISMEREEAERLELQRMMRGEFLSRDRAAAAAKGKKKDEASSSDITSGIRKLKITRTFRREDGTVYQRQEIVSKQNVIDIYVRIRETKDPGFIRQFASSIDDTAKEEMKKERRRIQEQLRRIKRNEDKDRFHPTSSVGKMRPPSSASQMSPLKKLKRELALSPLKLLKLQKASKLKCGACGQKGHMRTNRECPMFNRTSSEPLGLVGSVALSEEQEEELERANLVDSDLVNVEGTKVTLSKQLVEHAEQVKRKSLMLKFPRFAPEQQQQQQQHQQPKKKPRIMNTVHCDYLKKPSKLANRRRTDPIITISSIFESVLNEMRELPNVKLFLFPVNQKQVPDYFNIIDKPMDLQTMRTNVLDHKYLSREAFLCDASQIVNNCVLYNGAKHALTVAAQKMLDFCLQRFAEKEEKLMRLEKKINPLLDDNDLVAFGFILNRVIEERMKTIEMVHPFLTPVNRRIVKDYYERIANPMDIQTLKMKVDKQRYSSREEFLTDVALIVDNCVTYNGDASPLTAVARRIYDACVDGLKEHEDQLVALEASIQVTRQTLLDAGETDSVVTGTSVTGGDAESVDNKTKLGFDGTLQNDDDDDAQNMQGYLRDEEFVDVEGDEYDRSRLSRHDLPVDDSLEHDLQMTPENSDEEAESAVDRSGHRQRRSSTHKSPRFLSSSGSDSEHNQPQSSPYRFDQSHADVQYDDNAMMDYMGGASYDLAANENAGETESGEVVLDDDGASFDPQAFYDSIPKGQRGEDTFDGGEGGEGTDIHTDLQVSDSDDDDDDADDDAFVAVDDKEDYGGVDDVNDESNDDEFDISVYMKTRDD